MDQFLRDKNRNTVLVVNTVATRTLGAFNEALKELEVILKRKMKVLIVVEKRDKKAQAHAKIYPKSWDIITVNTKSVLQLEKALLPYLESIVVVECFAEKAIPFLKNIIPHIPYIETPTMESLAWSDDKINMRRRLRAHNKKLGPAYTIIQDSSQSAIDRIRNEVGYPAIIKPAGLAASALVRVVYDEEEAVRVIKKSLRKLRSVYHAKGYLKPPRMLIEQYMEGDMYSTDIYVNSRGTMYTTPLVHIMTGHKAGKGDFFGYRQMTPVLMKPYKHQAAFDIAKESVIAMGLRSITAHIELMKTVNGWKIIEVNPRLGGFREFMYQSSYGIKHTLNDLLIRLPMRPTIPRKAKGYSVVMKFYANKEGILERIVGKQKIKKLASYCKHDQNRHKGDKLLFARNGGSSVIDVYMFSKRRSDLLADIHRLEQILQIEVDSSRKPMISFENLTDPTVEGLGAIPQG